MTSASAIRLLLANSSKTNGFSTLKIWRADLVKGKHSAPSASQTAPIPEARIARWVTPGFLPPELSQTTIRLGSNCLTHWITA